MKFLVRDGSGEMMGPSARGDMDLNYYYYMMFYFKVGVLLSVVSTQYGMQYSYKDHFSYLWFGKCS